MGFVPIQALLISVHGIEIGGPPMVLVCCLGLFYI